jgi:hypothetical protein
MVKLLLILIMSGALAGALTPSAPPLLIDPSPAPQPATLDAAN